MPLTIDKFIEFYKIEFNLTYMIFNSILSCAMVLVPAIFLPLDHKISEDEKSKSEKYLDIVKGVFEKHNALSKETAIDKKIIREEKKLLNISGFKKFIIFDLPDSFRIKRVKGKVYFKEKEKKFRYGLLLSICILIWLCIFWNLFFKLAKVEEKYIDSITKEEKVEKAKNIEYKLTDNLYITMPDCLAEIENNSKEGYQYFQYLTNDSTKSDIVVVQIYYYPNYNLNENFEAFKNSIKENLSKYTILDEQEKNINDKKSLYYKLSDFDVNKDKITNVYILPVEDKMVEIDIYINQDKYSDENQKISDEIANSIKYN